jgi:predicted dipeptidase
MKRVIIVFSFLLLSCTPSQPENEISVETVKSIISSFSDRDVTSFDIFLDDVKKNTANKNVTRTISIYQSKIDFNSTSQVNFYRLISLYSRLKYKNEIFDILGKMVSIPTHIRPNIEQHDNEHIQTFGKLIESLSKEYGLTYKNIDNRIFEVILEGKTDQSFGIYTHGDVVPADPTKWVLDDGTQLNPFKLTKLGDKLYGRGTEDDKCSIAASMLAMRLLKEIGQVPNRTIRLIIETTEETSMNGFRYYKERHALPDYNIVLDSSYPIVTAEKGYGLITTSFKRFRGKRQQNEILSVSGGLASNQIPSTSIAKIKSRNISDLYKKVLEKIEPFKMKHGDNFSIELKKNKSILEIKLKGVSAHSSQPENGINPIPRMYMFLGELVKSGSFTKNHFTKAIKYVVDKINTDYLAKGFNVAYSDDFMGPLTSALTLSNLSDKTLDLAVNIRNPRGKSPEQLKTEIEADLVNYKKQSTLAFNHTVVTTPFMFRNPKGEWINTLLNIYESHTGKEGKPISSGGGTTAKLLPNAVCFGPSHPGEKYRGHNANEFKTIPNLYLDIEMFTEMLLRIGSLEKMD